MLEELALRVGCQYLSDLRGGGCRAQVCRLLRDIPPEAYPLPEWNDAVYYLTGQRSAFSSAVLLP